MLSAKLEARTGQQEEAAKKLRNEPGQIDIKEKPWDSCVVLYLDIVCVDVKVGELYVNGPLDIHKQGTTSQNLSQCK